ncbi:SCO1664 family protein [Tessaracoccus timonensis]|uniref:SCO1664 family protein n=1 Tax=Tessaracoccus timonensis TaxID=2161816 RepID=UPI00131F106F|nr:SCO1664 family protein [Tessaracoccus timonensis]
MSSLRILGRLLGASNHTFLAEDASGDRWVYKPYAGEQPLWDFPDGPLGRREVAAYALSEHLGLGLVPETVWGEGELGEGSLQRFIDGELTETVDVIPVDELTDAWLPIAAGEDGQGGQVVLVHRDDERLRQMALFDVLCNNSDRKAGHLIESKGRILGVDHGVTFHVDDKLRTVLWGFAGSPLTKAELTVAAAVQAISEPLADGLLDEEWEALRDRAARLCAAGVFPQPGTKWPAIPWPPF